jgi:hypothetical protein
MTEELVFSLLQGGSSLLFSAASFPTLVTNQSVSNGMSGVFSPRVKLSVRVVDNSTLPSV